MGPIYSDCSVIVSRVVVGSMVWQQFGKVCSPQNQLLSHGRLSSDLIPNIDRLFHTVATVLMKLVDKGSHLFLSLSQVLDKNHLAHQLSHHLDLRYGYLGL